MINQIGFGWDRNLKLQRPFHIKTDHYSLKYLLDQKANTPAQQAWIVKMMSYDYEVFFRQGSINKVADALSRVPQASLYAISAVLRKVVTQELQLP